MTSEAAFIAALRGLATHSAARGLTDDAAVLEVGGRNLVLTHDMVVEGVHFLADDPPADVAWKLVAVNLSDLAAKGARPVGALLGYTLGDPEWDAAFVAGLKTAIEAFDLPLLGGDTVSAPQRAFGLTAIGEADIIPSRSGAQAGDLLLVSGTIGEAGAGLRIARGELDGPAALVDRYRRPRPRLDLGQALAPRVHAMMDVSDGLLIDAARMAAASGLAVEIDITSVPLSPDYVACRGEDRAARLEAATGGDDYELLAAAPAPIPGMRAIGRFTAGTGLTLVDQDGPVPLPESLGYEHVSGG